MQIESVRIQNFRCFKDETIRLGNYTCIVGPNGSGKSTVLTALNVFFQETVHSKVNLARLDREDFYFYDGEHRIEEPIKITVTFTGLSPEATQDLKDYARHGKLIVAASAYWSEDDGCAPVVQSGERLGMSSFKSFFRGVSNGALVKELKDEYLKLRGEFPDLPPPAAKQSMIDALHAYEQSHENECEPIPSEDQFYGFSKGANRLAKYIQWVFVPAVKDASDEQLEANNTLLGKLLLRTVRSKVNFQGPLEELKRSFVAQYEEIVQSQQDALKELSCSMTKKLENWAHPGAGVSLEWLADGDKSIRVTEPIAQFIASDRSFRGKLARLGHGFQRSFILALLEELAQGETGDGPLLLLGCEEPELYQHPPQARHIAAVIEQLSKGNAQVIACTHSPYFVSGRQVEEVRCVRYDGQSQCSRCHSVTMDELTQTLNGVGATRTNVAGMLLKIEQALQPVLSELFFAETLVLVEGIEDAAYITTYMALLDLEEQFRKYRCHIVPAGGKSRLLQPMAIAKHLDIPCFVVFDSDRDKVPSADELDSKGHRRMHERDNLSILKLRDIESPDPFPEETLWSDGLVQWPSDIGRIVTDEITQEKMKQAEDKVRKNFQIIDGDLDKKILFVGYKLHELHNNGAISKSLRDLCFKIIEFAKARTE